MNWERVRADKLIGKCYIPIADLNPEGKEETKWFPIHTESARKDTLKRASMKKSEEEKSQVPASPTTESTGKPAGEVSISVKVITLQNFIFLLSHI